MKKCSALCAVAFCLTNVLAQSVINLQGEWRFGRGDNEGGLPAKLKDMAEPLRLDDTIELPGSMTTRGKGDEITLATQLTSVPKENNVYYESDFYERYRQNGNIKFPFILQPDCYYVGRAWYEREVTIPEKWRDCAVLLTLERAHWESTLYVDGVRVGMSNRLCAPQEFDLTGMISPGRHVFTVCVDNRIKDIDPGLHAHSIGDHTQGNWNGIVGRMTLEAKPMVYFDCVDVFPDLDTRQIRVETVVKNRSGKVQTAKFRIDGTDFETLVAEGESRTEWTVPMQKGVKAWDEFHPNLYVLAATLSTSYGEDKRMVRYGVRKWENRNGVLTLNGHPVFMRGNVDCGAFPLTGYPSVSRAYWKHVFRVQKNYGLNHVRFHSWCPPEVAFQVADEMGLYLYVECSTWAASWTNPPTPLGDGNPIDAFIYAEAEAIVRAYGNHPSFCMLSSGNEPGGKNHQEYLRAFVNYWKAKDSRRLYTSAAAYPNLDENDWQCDYRPRLGGGMKSIIESQSPSTTYDWSDFAKQFSQPVVSHEVGERCVYPNFREMKKYTGAFKPRNFEIFQDRLHDNGLTMYADSFLLASGKLQTLCYKAEIEAALRTKNFGGFELLGLNDFPGQGSAIVGAVDVFWDDKGYVTGEDYRHFCNSLVPLARIPKLIYWNDEIFNAHVEVANYFKPMMTDAKWTVRDLKGHVLLKGEFESRRYELGNCLPVGDVSFPLNGIKEAGQLNFEVRIGRFTNDWNFWVYPTEDRNAATANDDLLITDTINGMAADFLDRGGKVLLSLGRGRVSKDFTDGVQVGFASIFWNTLWIVNSTPNTLGLLCHPGHPALTMFPTAYHSDYQWQDILQHADAIRYDVISRDIQPIVRIIDDWFTARPLALAFEAKVGRGSILVCGADIVHELDRRPSACQLLCSFRNYMTSTSFHPAIEMDMETLRRMMMR